MSKRAVQAVHVIAINLSNSADSALAYAKDIKDPELTKKLQDLKSKAQGVKDYITEKTDPKTFG